MTGFGQSPVFKSIIQKQAWQQRLLREQQTVAATLSQLLLTPAQALLPGKRLMIVPGTTLSYLPFAALPECGVGNADCGLVASASFPKNTSSAKNTFSRVVPKSAIRNSKSSLLLILNHEIITLPSASTLGALRRANVGRAAVPKTLALFADPVFGKEDERARIAVAAPHTATMTTHNITASRNDDEAMPLLRLPSSRQEAETIADLVPESQCKLALDFDAARAAVLNEDLSQYRHVHFATHGVLNNEHPELSGLVFSMVDQQGVVQDGFLRTMDVLT